jgi:hypothetical protein
MALKKEDQTKLEPIHYLTMAQVVSETESVLRLLSAAIADGEVLDALDQIFPLEEMKKSPEQ